MISTVIRSNVDHHYHDDCNYCTHACLKSLTLTSLDTTVRITLVILIIHNCKLQIARYSRKIDSTKVLKINPQIHLTT